jgi:hypothetical protein
MSKNLFFTFLILFGFTNKLIAQFDAISQEIGVISGPVALQSDYGERKDLKTNVGNTSFGIGIVHYLNFVNRAYKSYSVKYFNDHFKLHSELSYNKTELQHFGRWVDKNNGSLGVQQLKYMKGSTAITNLGMQLEFFPWSLSEFEDTSGSFNPFISFGAQFSFYNPETYSLMGPL